MVIKSKNHNTRKRKFNQVTELRPNTQTDRLGKEQNNKMAGLPKPYLILEYLLFIYLSIYFYFISFLPTALKPGLFSTR